MAKECNTPQKVRWDEISSARIWAQLNGEYVYPCRSSLHWHTAKIRTGRDRGKARYWEKKLANVR